MTKTYDEASSFIHGRAQFKKIPTFTRMKRFLVELENLQEGLKYIHVTGTNSKGSAVAMMRSALLEGGFTIESFVPSSIIRFNERIKYDRIPISNDDLLKLIQEIAPVVKKLDDTLKTGGPTEFEIDTALMFCYMAEKKPDIILLEAGIEGPYDSTDVIMPVISVITTVGWDHTKYLGDTLAKIAIQRARIIKKDILVVLGALPTEVRETILADAKEKKSPVFESGKDFTVHKLNGHQFHVKIRHQRESLKKVEMILGLPSGYQIKNAAVVLMALELSMEKRKLAIDRRVLIAGLENVIWPGRLEEINTTPLVLLDGVHNLPGVQVPAHTIGNDFVDREAYLLVAILADEQYESMLGELASLGNIHLTVTHFAGPDPRRPSADLARAVADIPTKYPIQIINDWRLGVGQVASQMNVDDVMIITGSLYFVSDVRRFFLNQRCKSINFPYLNI